MKKTNIMIGLQGAFYLFTGAVGLYLKMDGALFLIGIGSGILIAGLYQIVLEVTTRKERILVFESDSGPVEIREGESVVVTLKDGSRQRLTFLPPNVQFDDP